MAELFLIAPHDAGAAALAAVLPGVLDRHSARVLLLPRGLRSEGDYKALVKAAAPIAQGRDVAVLIEGDPGDVKMLGADGLHVSGDLAAVTEAIEALKPDFIVGASGVASKHDAMERGELDIDYVFFGPLSGPIDPLARELARWWAGNDDRAERPVRSRRRPRDGGRRGLRVHRDRRPALGGRCRVRLAAPSSHSIDDDRGPCPRAGAPQTQATDRSTFARRSAASTI